MKAPGHLFLTGFMCSGKTRVGRALAERLGWPWYDVDREAEALVGPLQPYFASQGEAAFRELEHEVLGRLVQGERSVISCGGGTPLDPRNRKLMRGTGTAVLLHVSFPELLARIGRSGGDRPLLMGLTGAGLEERVGELLAERHAAYGEADQVVEADGSVEEVVEDLLRRFGPQAR